MKIKIVDNIKKNLEKENKYVKDVLAGKDIARTEKTIVMTPETFSKVFSPQRIRLILRIKKNKIDSIYQLAGDLERKYEAVHRDISYLESLGMIKIRSKDNKKIPFIDEKLRLPCFG